MSEDKTKTKAKAKKKTGRPTLDKPQVREKFLQYISGGFSLQKTCNQKGMPRVRTVLRWLRDDTEFRQRYELAIFERAEYRVEEIFDIADNSKPETAKVDRLRVDVRKWHACHMLPRYAQRAIEVNNNTTIIAGVDAPPVETREQWLQRQLKTIDHAQDKVIDAEFTKEGDDNET